MTQEVTVIDLSKMSAVELKKECKERSLKVSGTKAELIERLEEYMQQHEGAEIEEDDLLEEPDVSLEEESKENQVEENAAEKEKSPEKETTEKPAKAEEDPEAKKLSRAERFGIESKEVIESKKNQRAARFGLEANGKPKNEVDEKKRARAERFGTANGSGGKKSKLEGTDVGMDAEKLKARRERFGLPVAGGDADKKAARAARFANK